MHGYLLVRNLHYFMIECVLTLNLSGMGIRMVRDTCVIGMIMN